MSYLVPLSLLHIFLLTRLSLASARRLFGSSMPVFFAVVVLVWMNLVLTPLALSPFRLLGSPPAYFLCSLAIAGIVQMLVRRSSPAAAGRDQLSSSGVIAEIRRSPASMTLASLLVLVGAGVVLLAITVLPNNWDTLAYRFPKAFFYISSGALVHPAAGIDPRLLFYPYNGTVLYLFLAEYQWPAVLWTFVSVASWVIVGCAAFYVTVLLGGSVKAGLFSAYSLLTAPIVLCLANSTNDEVLASTPLLLAVVFGILWGRQRTPQALFFVLVSVAISVGVKLHWISLLPWFGFGVFLVWRGYRQEFLQAWRASVRPASLPVVLLLCAQIAGCSLVTNYFSARKLTTTELAGQILNRPFHLGAALQTTAILSAQMFLSPIPDHVRALGVEPGRRAYELANHFTMTVLFPNVRQGPPYTTPFYRFRGLVEPGAEIFFEQSLWIGFVPHFCLLALIWIAWERPTGSAWAVFLLSALVFWLITHSFLFRYVETVGTYAAYAAVLFAAPLGLAWEWMGQSRRRASRLLSYSFVLLVASNTVLAGTLLLSSQKRNLRYMWSLVDGETYVSLTTPALRAATARARKIHIPYLHEEVLYWNVMRLNPAARFTSSLHLEQPGADLTIYSITGVIEAERLIRIRDEDVPWENLLPLRAGRTGLVRLLGPLNGGQEMAFCTGQSCEESCVRCERFFLLPFTRIGEGSASRVALGGTPHGLDPSAEGIIRFTYSGESPHKGVRVDEIPLSRLAAYHFQFSTAEYTRLAVEVIPSDGHGVARTIHPLETGKRLFQPGWAEAAGAPY